MQVQKHVRTICRMFFNYLAKDTWSVVILFFCETVCAASSEPLDVWILTFLFGKFAKMLARSSSTVSLHFQTTPGELSFLTDGINGSSICSCSSDKLTKVKPLRLWFSECLMLIMVAKGDWSCWGTVSLKTWNNAVFMMRVVLGLWNLPREVT